jgi:hypothetical protein
VWWEPEHADPNVGSFMPAFRWVVERTDGPILELGGGYFSTPFLAEQHRSGRLVCTYEFDASWAEQLRARFPHRITDVLPQGHWSVVLVDCEGWSRLPYFRALAPRADVFVVHDSQDPWIPEGEYERYTYRADLDENPRTTVVSSLLDVRECR